jgi:hypothetical protein
MFDHNTINTSSFGMLDAVNLTQIIGSQFTCNGDTLPGYATNGSGCWAVQNTLSGRASNGSATSLNTGCTGQTYIPGHYYGNILLNGAVISGCGTNQLSVPWP